MLQNLSPFLMSKSLKGLIQSEMEETAYRIDGESQKC